MPASLATPGWSGPLLIQAELAPRTSLPALPERASAYLGAGLFFTLLVGSESARAQIGCASRTLASCKSLGRSCCTASVRHRRLATRLVCSALILVPLRAGTGAGTGAAPGAAPRVSCVFLSACPCCRVSSQALLQFPRSLRAGSGRFI
uniref:Uncharacterized protein n=1 Tax=Knipowitschia caucasica TaxID=637954 RepID=A0AAV2J4Q2_KNICA